MEIKSAFRSWVSRWGFVVSMFSFLAFVILAATSINEFLVQSRWVEHTTDVIATVREVSILSERAAAGQRAYIIKPDQEFYDVYSKAVEGLTANVDILEQLISDNPVQLKNYAELKHLLMVHLENLEKRIKIRDQQNITSINDLRAVFAKMIAEEDRLMKIRTDRTRNIGHLTILFLIFGAGLAAGLMFLNRRSILKASEKVVEQSNLFNLILHSIGDGLIVVNTSGNLIHYNEAISQIFEFPFSTLKEDIRGYFKGLLDPKTLKPFSPERSPLALALKGEGHDSLELLYRKNPETTQGIHLAVSTRALYDGAGEIVGALALIRNITKQKNMETDWKKAEQAALEASKLKSDFLATMSHEIRTPMNGVIGMSTLLLETPLSHEQNSFVKTIKSSADALLTLINDILDHSKIEAGKLTLENSDFNLQNLVENVMDVFHYQATSKKIELTAEILHEGPLNLRGDAARFRQILINLIGNAIKFTSKGYVQLKISIPDPMAHPHALLCEVRDTGAGIPAEYQPRLFERFSQAHHGHFKKFGGTGLGLLISKEFVHLMKGQIGAESVEGFGSRFWFTCVFDQVQGAVSIQSNGRKEFRKMDLQVLVAEDQPVNQVVIRKFLELFGVTYQIVEDGTAAVEAFTKNTFDLIIMDCQMQPMDGYEATRRIRELEKSTHEHIPILALTAEGMTGDRDRCFLAGMDEFLTKPIDIDILYQALQQKQKRGTYPTLIVSQNRPIEVPSASPIKTSGSATYQTFNPEALKKMEPYISEGQPLSVMLVDEYLKTTADHLKKLLEAIKAHDTKSVKSLSHSMKSTSRAVGLDQLGHLFELLEDGCLVPVAPEDLETGYFQGVIHLQEYLKKFSSSAA